MSKSRPVIYLYNNIFFPNTIIPINVNDQLTKDLLIKSTKHQSKIIFYYPCEKGKRIATLGEIIHLEKNPDQSFTALIKGLKRVQLQELDKNSLPEVPHYFSSDYCDNEHEPHFLPSGSVERLYSVLKNFLNENVPSHKDRELFLKEINGPSKLIFNLCMFLVKDLELKQIFLESTSLIDRIRMMDALLNENQSDLEVETIKKAIKDFDNLDSVDIKNAS